MLSAQANQLRSDDASSLVQRAAAALEAKDATTAAELARNATELAPNEASGWALLAIALHRAGRLDEAIAAARRATTLNPRAADYHTNLGVIQRAAGRIADAEASYRQAISADPKFAAAYNNFGNLLREQARYGEAELAYKAATTLSPSYADALHGLGIVIENQGRAGDAIPYLEQASALRPTRGDILSDLATAYMAMQRMQEASSLLQKAITVDPGCALAFGNLGALKIRLGHMVAAEQATRRAMQLAPNEARWVSNLGVCVKDLGRFDEAEELYRRAFAMRPGYALAHSNLLFCLNYHPDKSAEQIFAEYKAFDAAHAKPLMPADATFANDRTPGRRLKVGYLSPDFREHAARHFLEPLLAHHDRSEIELYCYAEVATPDHVTAHMQSLVPHWRSTIGMSNAALADQIRKDGIDILVDFGGHTSSSRLLVMGLRPAPVQIEHHLGHGYTSGLSAVDAFLSDSEMAPVGSEHLFAEKKIVRLSRIPVAYMPPQGLPDVAPLPAKAQKRPITFGYFGRTERINDKVIPAWAAILNGVPGSRLMLNTKALSEEAFADLMAARFASHGIGRERLALVYTSPQSKTWDAYGDVDIALDPFPHNAGTTTIEALWLGVPVVSVADRPSVGRFGASNLAAAGLLDWLAPNVESYIKLAIAKASDLDALDRLRAGLRQRMLASPLNDGKGLARELERAYRSLWTDWCATTSKQPEVAAAAVTPAVSARRAAVTQTLHGLDSSGRLVEAVKLLTDHLAQDATDLDTLTYLSDIYRRLGRLTDAEKTARNALSISPRYAAAANALGNALAAQIRLTEAEAAFTMAIEAKPNHAEAYNNRALSLMRRGQLVSAERDLRKALDLRPDLIEMGFNLANSLQDQGRIAEAVETFQKTLARSPNHARGHGMMLFSLTYHPGLTGDQILAEFKRWNEMHAARFAPKNPIWPNDRTPGRRLRVGYVSPDFANKSSRHFIEPILVGHDRSKVEIFCYAEVPAPDAETYRLKALSEHWRGTVGLTDDELADLIRRDQIDVLVDLGGHTARNRLLAFARKPAPVQVAHFLGHGYTSGMTAMDAFMADDELAPPGSDHLFAEPVIRLPRMPVTYSPPTGMPDVTPLPALKNGYITFGNFGRVVRLNEEVIATWAQILNAVPRSRLVLNTVSFLDEAVRDRFAALFEKAGIDRARLDLVFTTPQPRTWEAYGEIDIALDPFPHNGGTTTIEAAWLGVPSICLRSRPSVGCFGATILGSLGLSDWVVSNREDYVAEAVKRASDLQALAELRAGLRARMAASPLCDAKGLGHELERAYQKLWQDYCDRETAIEILQQQAAQAYGKGDYPRAITLFQEALRRGPRASIYSNLGAAFRAAGRAAEAEAAYREAIARQPDFGAAHGNLGNLLSGRGRFAEAETHLRRALELQPNDISALRNLALCLMRQQRLPEAEPLLREASARLPHDGDIQDNLAQLLRQNGEPVAASRLYEAVKHTTADNWRVIGNMALLAQDLGEFDRAEALFRRALELKPDYALAGANLLFCVNYHPDKTAEAIFEEYKRFEARHALPHMPAEAVHANDRNPERRLKVGFLSPDFREHAARHFLDPLLTHYNRDAIELYCYAEVANPDAITTKFQSLASQWRSTVGLSDDEVADLIRKDGIDILVDFGGHTSSSRILVMARRPAPIQVAHHLGHGYTSGMSAIDVFLSDSEMAPPGSEHLFAEKRIVRLPRIPVAYAPPTGMPEVPLLPALLKRRPVTFGYFGRPERINHRVVEAWSRILTKTPGARLMLNSRPFKEVAFCDAMAARFAKHGIGRERLELVYTNPQPRTWDAYSEVDIALDPFPHNAGTTTIEALYLGVPVVSVIDRPSVGRFGASNLSAVGLRDWLANDVDEYVEIAATKARDLAALALLRGGLRKRVEASPLCDGRGLCHDLETAFRDLWREWCGAPGKALSREPKPYAAAVQAFEAGDLALAAALATERLAANPADTESRHLRAVVLYRQGRAADAIKDMQRAIREEPERPDLRWNITAMLRVQGRLAEAETHGREAVRLAPNAPEAHNNLGTVYKDLSSQEAAEHHLRRAIELRPGYSDAWANLSWVLSLSGRAREAEAAARKAAEINPRDANALNNLGTSMMQQDRLREAGECFAKAVSLKPDFAIAHSNELFCLNYRTDLSAEEIFAAYQRWDAMHAKPLAPKAPVYRGSKDPNRRLKIGYASADFRYHAVSFFIEPFLAAHDPRAVEVTCYAEVANPDDVTERFRRHSHRWRSTVGMSDADLAAQIMEDEIDVLVDLAGHTSGNRLLTFARKPAPVQVAHMVGAGTTTGLSAIDAFLINEALLPQGYDKYFSERPIRLSRMPHVYAPPPGMPPVAPLPALKNGYITFGCFSRAARINEQVIAAWARILRSVPNSRLILNSKPFREQESRGAWHARFAAHKINPERVDLVYTSPQPTTWAAYGQVDIALDPFPHNAGTTTIEALWLGVPVVSMTGRPPVGRFGASILGSLKLDDWVTNDIDAYVARAIMAASNVSNLEKLRSELRRRFIASPIGSDAEGLAREIEAAYRSLWIDYCKRG